MSNKTAKLINTVYGVIMSLLVLTAALLLILSALDIYNSGARPYSRESIGEHFELIAPVVYSCIILAAGGILLHFLLPTEETRPRGSVSTKVRYKRAKSKLRGSSCSAEELLRLLSLRKRRYILTSIGAVLYISATVLALTYVTNKENFAALDANREILTGALAIGICLVIPFIYSVVLVYLNDSIMRSEIKLMQSIAAGSRTEPGDIANITEEPKCPIVAAEQWTEAHQGNILLILRCVIVSAAVVLIVLGIINGGADDVLGKAIKICTECIGLG